MIGIQPVYSPLYGVPADGGPVIFDYSMMRKGASVLHFFIPVKVSIPAAEALAALSPYPRGVKVGFMKQIANNKHVTLHQMRILLGWAADRAQR